MCAMTCIIKDRLEEAPQGYFSRLRTRSYKSYMLGIKLNEVVGLRLDDGANLYTVNFRPGYYDSIGNL